MTRRVSPWVLLIGCAPLLMASLADCGGDPSPSCWTSSSVPMMGCSGPHPSTSTSAPVSRGGQSRGHKPVRIPGEQPKGDSCAGQAQPGDWSISDRPPHERIVCTPQVAGPDAWQ